MLCSVRFGCGCNLSGISAFLVQVHNRGLQFSVAALVLPGCLFFLVHDCHCVLSPCCCCGSNIGIPYSGLFDDGNGTAGSDACDENVQFCNPFGNLPAASMHITYDYQVFKLLRVWRAPAPAAATATAALAPCKDRMESPRSDRRTLFLCLL